MTDTDPMTDDGDLDACPYDFPVAWIARELDSLLQNGVSRDEIRAAAVTAQRRFSREVAMSDPNQDKSEEAVAAYSQKHTATEIPDTAGNPWPTLCILTGPFYGLAVTLRGTGLHIISLDSGHEERVPLS